MEEVLQEGDATVKVDIDLLTELLLTADGSQHLGLRDGPLVLGPLLVLGFLEELAKLLVKVETEVQLHLVSLIVLVDELDTLGVHIGILDGLPGDSENELGLGSNLGPVGVQEVNGLLGERFLADHVEVVKGLLVKLLGKGRHD